MAKFGSEVSSVHQEREKTGGMDRPMIREGRATAARGPDSEGESARSES